MRNVTLSQMRLDARLYADQRAGGTVAYITDTELDRLINLSITGLYDVLVKAGGHEYYRSSISFVTTSTVNMYSGTPYVPADHYITLRMALNWGNSEIEDLRGLSLLEFSTLETHGTWGRGMPKGYRLQGPDQIEIRPTPTSANTITHVYVPTFADMTTTTATFNGVNGWERVVALDVAMQIRAIMEKSYADLQALYERDMKRIETAAAERASFEPHRMIDIQPEGGYRAWFPQPRT